MYCMHCLYRSYGFHGTSYKYLTAQVRVPPPPLQLQAPACPPACLPAPIPPRQHSTCLANVFTP